MKIFKYLVVSLTLLSVTTQSYGQLKSNTVDSRQVAITWPLNSSKLVRCGKKRHVV